MCMGVHYNGQYAHNQQQLAELVGRDKIVMSDGSEFHPEYCLCPVDFFKTAENVNCCVDAEKHSFIDVEFVPRG